MADDRSVLNAKSSLLASSKVVPFSPFPSKPLLPRLSKQKTTPSSRRDSGGNSDDVFKDRAISFLKSINTGSPALCGKPSAFSEPLHLVPNDAGLNLARTQEETLEICKVQAWVTSGVVKKSYQHCLDSEFTTQHDRPWINLNEFPGRIIRSPIKEQLNEEFRKTHQYLDRELTLSKLVNLREDLVCNVWRSSRLDPVTLAIGLTLFDRLLNMNLVNKVNRKLYAAVCVLLAYKFMEETHLDEKKIEKNELMSQLYHMDKHDLLTKKIILETEFSVFAYLGFSMHLSFQEIKENLNYVRNRLSQ
jgi:hypothetical protein